MGARIQYAADGVRNDKGFEVMHMIRKRHCLMLETGTTGEVRFVNRLFRVAA
jgi:hypothetical protein